MTMSIGAMSRVRWKPNPPVSKKLGMDATQLRQLAVAVRLSLRE